MRGRDGRCASILALAALAVGCGRGAASGATGESARVPRIAPPDADDDLREVVMRDLIATFGNLEWSSVLGEEAVPVNVLCTGFGEGVDPSDAFMARFTDEHRVVKASRCRYDEEGGKVRAQPSGLPGMFLYVEDVRREGNRAQAKGSYFYDGTAAKQDLFLLERDVERWIVKSRTMIWIS